MLPRILTLLTLILCGAAPAAEHSTPFFAMNTIARGDAATVVPMLKELGYDGLGGSAGDGAMADALEAQGLRFFNGYLTLEFQEDKPILNDQLRHQLDAMAGHRAALWLAITRVSKAGVAVPKSSSDGDEIVVAGLREIAGYAAPHDVKVALYPHTGLWLERVEDAIRVADKVDLPTVGVTFNLCHWLKVEGAERDPAPVLRAALPRLMFVTINGADTGETRQMGWDRLIQPLDAGTYDLTAFLRTLRATGYTGPIGFQGFGIKEDPRTVLARTMSAWQKLQR